MNAAEHGATYKDLVVYVRRRYITVDQLRRAIAMVTNGTLIARNPAIWGEGTTACASDSKHFGAWDQNLTTQWHVRYGGRGIMIYWHVDEPLRHYCLCCHREEPRWIVTREGKDEEVQCRHWGTALHHWPRENIEQNVILIMPTKFFHGKSEDSYGPVEVDPQLMELFRGYSARARGPFVIESDADPKPDVTYEYHRCQKTFKRLVNWLRSKGLAGNKPLHALRKEFGSLINAKAGIHASSRALRHANVTVTDMYYADSRARVTVGPGQLLEPDNLKVTPITAAAHSQESNDAQRIPGQT